MYSSFDILCKQCILIISTNHYLLPTLSHLPPDFSSSLIITIILIVSYPLSLVSPERIHWDEVSLPVTMSLKKSCFPSLSSHQTQRVLHLGVWPRELFPIHAEFWLAGFCSGLQVSIAAVCWYARHPCMSTSQLFTATFPSPGSFILSALYSIMFPELCMRKKVI